VRDVSDFSSELTSLHPFFTLLGGAAATFVGLLFIAVTWNPYLLASQADPRLLRVVVNAFRDLLFILILSLLLLLPLNSAKEVGQGLIYPSAVFLMLLLVGVFRNPGGESQISQSRRIRFHAVSGLVYVTSFIAAVLLLFQGERRPGSIDFSISLLINASFLGLFSAIQVAWYVLITARKNELSASSELSSANTENSEPGTTNRGVLQ
jgi:hypothetical protein